MYKTLPIGPPDGVAFVPKLHAPRNEVPVALEGAHLCGGTVVVDCQLCGCVFVCGMIDDIWLVCDRYGNSHVPLDRFNAKNRPVVGSRTTAVHTCVFD